MASIGSPEAFMATLEAGAALAPLDFASIDGLVTGTPVAVVAAISANGGTAPVPAAVFLDGAAIVLGQSLTAAEFVRLQAAAPESAGSIQILFEVSDGVDMVRLVTSILVTAARDETHEGDAAANRLDGAGGNDLLFGLGGDDLLIGGSGDDRIDGGEGADRMIGGLGNDTFLVDDLEDRVEDAGGADTIRTTVDIDLRDARFSGTFETVVLEGRVALAIGSVNGERIEGNDAKNIMHGFDGDDVLVGGKGRDRLGGWTGDDTLDGGGGADILSGGDGDDLLDGGSGRDVLSGGDGNDTLAGGGGRDLLDGGKAGDELTGGDGADRFVFRSVEDSVPDDGGRDLVTDFDAGEGDLIDLREIDARADRDGNNRFTFIGAEAFSGRAGELRHQQDGTSTLVYGDVTGDGTADFAVELAGLVDLTAGDFIL